MHNILSLLKEILNKDWPTIFGYIERMETTARDVLVALEGLHDEIRIENRWNATVQVAVSTTSVDEASHFFEIQPGKSVKWKRTKNECVFINEVGSNRVVIAMAGPGVYKIQDVE